MKVGSLFTGIGGLDLGLERAGMDVIWQCESDPFRHAVLERHWPGVLRYSDVREVGAGSPVPDLICGGFPCQPVSEAGRGQTEADERWLWPDFARVLSQLRPRVILVENVPALLGRGMGEILGDLSLLGYDTEWQVVSAASVGAPHLRERIFLVAYPEGHPLGSGLRPDLQARLGWRRPRNFSRPGDTWSAEPDVGRVAHGLPARLDRLAALGDAVVPQVAETLGRWILDGQV